MQQVQQVTNWNRFFLKHSCNPRWVTRTNAPRCHHWALLSSHTLVALLQRCLHWPSGVQDDSSHNTEYHATRLLKFTQPRVYNTSIVYSNWSPNYRRKYPLYFEYISKMCTTIPTDFAIHKSKLYNM